MRELRCWSMIVEVLVDMVDEGVDVLIYEGEKVLIDESSWPSL